MSDVIVKERLNSLESTLQGFITSTDGILSRMEQDTADFKMRTENMLERIMLRMDRDTLASKLRTDSIVERMQYNTENITAKLDHTINEMKQDTEKMKKDMNKKWGELANKMGTVVEDIVAPNISGIARKYFGIERFEDFSIRYNRRNRVNPGKVKEFDAIAVSKDAFIVNETKATARESYVDEFVQLLNEEIYTYFPEHREKRLIPIFSCLHIPENIQNRLTKEKIYAMAMGGETMDILNFDKIHKSVESV